MSHSKYTLKNALGVNIPLNEDKNKRRKDFDKAMKIFNRKMKDSDKLNEFTERMEYTKPTTRRREERKQAKNNARKNNDY